MNSQFVCFLVALVVSSDMQARLLYDVVRSVRRTGLKFKQRRLRKGLIKYRDKRNDAEVCDEQPSTSERSLLVVGSSLWKWLVKQKTQE